MNWLLAGLIAVAALGMGWLGKSWQDGQQAKIDLQAAKDAQAALTTSLTQAALEADKLKLDMGDIANRLEDALNENAARASSSRAVVRQTVAATPDLANGRLSSKFRELFNATRSPRDAAGVGTAAGGAGSNAAAVVPPGAGAATSRPR